MSWPEKWKGKIWNTQDGPLCEHELRCILLAIRDGLGSAGVCKVFNCGPADRRVYRGQLLLRKEGLIVYGVNNRGRGEWFATDAGRAALREPEGGAS